MSHFTKGDPGLSHAPDSGIETEEEDRLRSGEILVEILQVGVLTVVQGIEDVFHFGVSKVKVDNLLS